MPERLVSVGMFLVKYDCAKCGTEMRCGDVVLPTNPPKYPHQCPRCGHSETLDRAYPRLEHYEGT